MNGYGNATQPVSTAPREATLNERLNRSLIAAQDQCNRIESVLARVNGTPQAISGNDKGAVAPQFPLGAAVEQAEILAQRLANLATSIEQIA